MFQMLTVWEIVAADLPTCETPEQWTTQPCPKKRRKSGRYVKSFISRNENNIKSDHAPAADVGFSLPNYYYSRCYSTFSFCSHVSASPWNKFRIIKSMHMYLSEKSHLERTICNSGINLFVSSFCLIICYQYYC